MQPFLLGHLLAGAGQAALIDVLLKAPGLSPTGVHARQRFGERSSPMRAVEAATAKVQKEALTQQIQVAHTASSRVMPYRRGSLTARTQTYGMTMFAERIQHFLPFELFIHIAVQFKFGQVEPLAQRGSVYLA